MKFFQLSSFLLFLFLSSCGSNESNLVQKVDAFMLEIQNADKKALSEQAFYTKVNELEVKKERIYSLLENNNQVTKNQVLQINDFFAGFTQLSLEKTLFKENKLARKALIKRVQFLKNDIHKDLGKKELKGVELNLEKQNWKLINMEYKAFIESADKLNAEFGIIRLNLMRR